MKKMFKKRIQKFISPSPKERQKETNLNGWVGRSFTHGPISKDGLFIHFVGQRLTNCWGSCFQNLGWKKKGKMLNIVLVCWPVSNWIINADSVLPPRWMGMGGGLPLCLPAQSVSSFLFVKLWPSVWDYVYKMTVTKSLWNKNKALLKIKIPKNVFNLNWMCFFFLFVFFFFFFLQHRYAWSSSFFACYHSKKIYKKKRKWPL